MTNKELLQDISQKQLQLSADFSIYRNETDVKFSKILNHLESDSKTNTKGVIEQQSINTADISNIKTDKKIVYSFAIAIAFLSNIIFKYLWK